MSNNITIDTDYNKLKIYYNEKLNKNKALFKTSNDEPTPIECVEEMIDKYPEELFKNPELKILDPCCGMGNFHLVIYKRLLNYHNKKDILENMLYFNDINKDRLNILRKVFQADKYKLNITEQDFLTYNEGMKYGLIVNNPPYAKLLPNGKRASKNHNLIGVFIEKTLKILKEGGHIIYITPDNWMSYADRNKLIKVLTEKQILHLNIHTAKKYFKKVGSSFTWYVIENKPYYKDIEVEGIWKKKVYKSKLKSEVRSYIPLFYNDIIQSILSKTVDKDNEKFKVETSSYLHKYTKKKFISATEDNTFKYKLIHTPKQTVWSKIPHKYQDSWKVFISTTSYYKVFVDNCGMTQSIVFIQCENKEEADKVAEVLNHPMYRFINNICRWGNFNNIRILQHMPYETDYDNVYNKFGLTEEEIKLIEENI